jgi:predicted dienelactone hydrolase
MFDIPTADTALPLTGIVWTPCAAPASEVELGGGVILPGVRDCPISGNRLPLIVVSHGRRGSFIAHNDTAAALADAGFVVAAINHPGDNARDSSRTDEFSVLVERPADIKRLTDFMLGAWKEAAVLDPQRIGLFGFSRGAYTAWSSSAAIRISAPLPRSANRLEQRRRNARRFAKVVSQPQRLFTTPALAPPSWQIHRSSKDFSVASAWPV